MPLLYRPSGDRCADRVLILGITFLRIATINKPGAIYPSNFCLFGSILPKELLLQFVPSSVCRPVKWRPHYRRSRGGTVSFRIQSGKRRIRNSGFCHAFIASRRRSASTLTSAPGHISLNKLFLRKAIMQGFYIYLYYSFWTTLFYGCR